MWFLPTPGDLAPSLWPLSKPNAAQKQLPGSAQGRDINKQAPAQACLCLYCKIVAIHLLAFYLFAIYILAIYVQFIYFLKLGQVVCLTLSPALIRCTSDTISMVPLLILVAMARAYAHKHTAAAARAAAAHRSSSRSAFSYTSQARREGRNKT